MNTYLVRRNRTPFARFNDAVRATSAVDTMFDRMVRDAFGNGWQSTWQREWADNAPAVDLAETPEAYVVKAALPGWKPEQVDISFENGVLTLKGEVADETEKDETNGKDGSETIHVREIRKGSFLRRFTLPAEVDADKATAEFEHGVLTLSIPKAEVVKPKQIKIAVK
jgi:HSP20 family protein